MMDNKIEKASGASLSRTVAAQLWPTGLQTWLRETMERARVGEGAPLVYLLAPTASACGDLRRALAELAMIDGRHIMLGEDQDVVVDGTVVSVLVPMVWELAQLGGAEIGRDTFALPGDLFEDLAAAALELSACL